MVAERTRRVVEPDEVPVFLTHSAVERNDHRSLALLLHQIRDVANGPRPQAFEEVMPPPSRVHAIALLFRAQAGAGLRRIQALLDVQADEHVRLEVLPGADDLPVLVGWVVGAGAKPPGSIVNLIEPVERQVYQPGVSRAFGLPTQLVSS